MTGTDAAAARSPCAADREVEFVRKIRARAGKRAEIEEFAVHQVRRADVPRAFSMENRT